MFNIESLTFSSEWTKTETACRLVPYDIRLLTQWNKDQAAQRNTIACILVEFFVSIEILLVIPIVLNTTRVHQDAIVQMEHLICCIWTMMNVKQKQWPTVINELVGIWHFSAINQGLIIIMTSWTPILYIVRLFAEWIKLRNIRRRQLDTITS
jgi:hypothetical protein